MASGNGNMQPINATLLSSSSPLELYDPAHSPVLNTNDFNGASPAVVKVGIVTIYPLTGEAMHFMYDGVMGSAFLKLVHVVSLYGLNNYNQTEQEEPEPTEADVWIVDGARVAKLQRTFLTRLLHSPDATWKVIMLDFSDRFQFQLNRYHKIDIWGRDHVRLAVRSIVQGRHYGNEQHGIVPGRIAPNLQTTGGPMIHSPYAVRSDIVQVVQNVTAWSNGSPISHEKTLEGLGGRPMDILHLWQISFKEGKSKLRNDVSKLVRSWNGTQMAGRTVKISIDEQGNRRQLGRNSVDPAYVKALLSSKIVIVTQKDDWEDHYRLMEALACGPLVLADAMLAPPRGLVHGDTILYFKSMVELEQLVAYYLEHEEERITIARKGWRLVMRRHRSWHRMEELLFGQPLTMVR